MADIILSEKDIKRFWAKTRRDPATGCLVWTGGRTPYGAFCAGGRMVGAHRVAWVLAHGPIPTGAYVLHHCDNPPCVEVGPGHLFLGDALANSRDKIVKGRYRNGYMLRTHCGAGHLLSGDNLRVNRRGARVCVTCARAYHEKWMAAHPGLGHQYYRRWHTKKKQVALSQQRG